MKLSNMTENQQLGLSAAVSFVVSLMTVALYYYFK